MTVHPGPAGLISLHGKVVLVTGGSGGIGSATVRLLLGAGGEVVSADCCADAVEGAVAIQCDIAQPQAVEQLVKEVFQQFGRLDALVHCAGITRDGVLWKLAPEDWSKVLATNLDSAFHLLRHAAPLLRASGDAAVVLVSSINGERGKFGQANYAASKAGLIALGKTAARELGAFGVRVNMIAPGLIRTPMTSVLAPEHLEQAVRETALGRLGDPEDVAGAVLFLCSDMSRHVTGHVLRVDGGQWMA